MHTLLHKSGTKLSIGSLYRQKARVNLSKLTSKSLKCVAHSKLQKWKWANSVKWVPYIDKINQNKCIRFKIIKVQLTNSRVGKSSVLSRKYVTDSDFFWKHPKFINNRSRAKNLLHTPLCKSENGPKVVPYIEFFTETEFICFKIINYFRVKIHRLN